MGTGRTPDGDTLLALDAQAQAGAGRDGAKPGVPGGWAAVVGPWAALSELVCVPGGILAGLISDYTSGRATTCFVMLILGAPMVGITSGQSACAYVPVCIRPRVWLLSWP